MDKIAKAESLAADSASDDSSDLGEELGLDDQSDGDSSLDYARNGELVVLFFGFSSIVMLKLLSFFLFTSCSGSQSDDEEDDIEAETTDGFLIPGLSSNRVAYMTPQRFKPLPAEANSEPLPSTSSSSSRKTRKVMYVAKDEDGNYRLPVQIGALTLLSLGQVVWDREGFHNDRYIWPVGYSVQR